MRNLDSCRCWRCTLCPCKVRNKFIVNFWNRTILLCIPCINNTASSQVDDTVSCGAAQGPSGRWGFPGLSFVFLCRLHLLAEDLWPSLKKVRILGTCERKCQCLPYVNCSFIFSCIGVQFFVRLQPLFSHLTFRASSISILNFASFLVVVFIEPNLYRSPIFQIANLGMLFVSL
jgi:hypothetical protein